MLPLTEYQIAIPDLGDAFPQGSVCAALQTRVGRVVAESVLPVDLSALIKAHLNLLTLSIGCSISTAIE
ncbi:hypothetical protein D3C76_928520 [compost metagenome]